MSSDDKNFFRPLHQIIATNDSNDLQRFLNNWDSEDLQYNVVTGKLMNSHLINPLSYYYIMSERT